MKAALVTSGCSLLVWLLVGLPLLSAIGAATLIYFFVLAVCGAASRYRSRALRAVLRRLR